MSDYEVGGWGLAHTYPAAEDAAGLLATVENLYDVRDMDLMQAALLRRVA